MALTRLDLGATPPTVEWLVPGYIPAGYVTVLFSKPGVGKTRLVSYIAAQVTRPRGEFAGRPVRRGRVLILDADDPDGLGYKLWLHRFFRAYGDASREDVDLRGVTGELTPEDIQALMEELTPNPPALIVVDAFSSAFLGLDVIKPHQVHAPVRLLTDLAQAAGAALILVDHVGKLAPGQTVAEKGPLGSVAKTLSPRAVFALERVPPAMVDGRDVSRLTCVKQSYAPLPPDIGLELVWNKAEDTAYYRPYDLPEQPADLLERAMELITKALAASPEGLSRENAISAVVRANISRRTAERALAQLKREGKVQEEVLRGKGSPKRLRLTTPPAPGPDPGATPVGALAENARNAVQDGATFSAKGLAEDTSLAEHVPTGLGGLGGPLAEGAGSAAQAAPDYGPQPPLLPQAGSGEPAATTPPPPPVEDRTKQAPVHYIGEGSSVEAILPVLEAQAVIGFDLETTGLDPKEDKIRLATFAVNMNGREAAVVVDLHHHQSALEILRPVFEADKGPVIVGHNLKFDTAFLMARGVHPNGKRLWDTGLVHQILTAAPRMPSLGELAGLDKTLQTSDWGGGLTEAQIQYAANDALAVIKLYREQRTEVVVNGLAEVVEVEMRALPAITWMGLNGVPFDREEWRRQVEASRAKVEEARKELEHYGAINWNSPKQILQVLKEHGLDVASTSDEELAAHRDHPVVEALLRYREAAKRLSAFGERWLEHVDQEGRLRPSWHQIGAATGRMSSSGPNIQQLPRGETRKAIRPGPGRALVKADYSQIELRLAAAIAPDVAMASAFKEGADLHTLTAQKVLGVEEVSKSARQLAKALNFGLIYGMGPEKLRVYARSGYGVDISPEDAQRFREAFFQTYKGLKTWHRSTPDGEVEVKTLLGRKRRTGNFTEKLNTPVQGSGADGLKLALALLYERRNQVPEAFPVLAVHDEVVVEAPREKALEAAEWLKAAMVEAMGYVMAKASVLVPVEVEVGVYEDWGITPVEP